MSSVMRSVKNVTKGYSSVQVKVRNATSNDPWGPTGGDMADIAKITYNSSTDFYEVMDMLDKRLNDKGKNWRHVLKSLKVLDYCLHEGSELVVTWARKNIYIIKTLREFIYLDDESRDVGASIRHSAKELTSLILDEERLRAERTNRGAWKSRVTGLDDMGLGYSPSEQPTRRPRQMRPQREDEDDLEYRLAIEASKNEAEADAARRATSSGGGGGGENDDDLAKAIKLSKEEEELRQRELEDQNQANLLFDDAPTEQVPQPTGSNQGYQQQSQVDWFGNPIQQQQPQSTGFLNNAYSQPTGQFQNGYGGGYGYNQPQQTGYDPMQQPAQQFIQPQNTYNPWAQQMQQQQPTNGFGNQQQPQQEQQPAAQAGSNNPWASNQTASPIGAQPTGSNNPFATHRPAAQSSFSQAPTLSTLAEQQATSDFSRRPNPISSFSTPGPAPGPISTPSPVHQQQQQAPRFPSSLSQQQTAQPPQDPYQAKLNALLSSGEGQDTFGNTGDMRIPAQHTAPGTFVNSAGAGSMGRLEASKTGNNPFFSQNTAAQQQFPAQTGPAMGFGGNANPFGSRAPGQQAQQQQGYGGYGQQQGQQGGGSLIDL
ncbi:uncharacterized protein LTR77_001300 [Saxophila tyrrhenica]|uniref:ENTH domain-containing protein n=1 Tax=Saxophila tyrrhenica TaxID=1690608 RepID=A0AAV9PJW9_9PEZI|nr:hypothetical protein LTR77_001300 [Saxophila tyrrhenica]